MNLVYMDAQIIIWIYDSCVTPVCFAACYGLGTDNQGVMDNHGITMVTSSNVEEFNKCKKIFGSLAFFSQSFAR